MLFGNLTPKQIIACSAIIDIIRIFADTEVGGQYEIDYDALCNYLDSLKFSADYFSSNDKEEIYERFTQDIYNGLPVWRFLKLPKWTMDMVEKSFKDETQEIYDELAKIYKCLTCKYFKVEETSIGTLSKCLYEERKESQNSHRMCGREWHSLGRREGPFEPKTKCVNYVHKEELK